MSASFAVLFSQLRDYVRTVQKAHPTLAKESDALAYWFCQAALLNPDGVADIKKAIVGYKGNDRAIDVIAIDHLSQNVYIVQVKARQYLMSPSESSAEVCKFANVAQAFKTPSLAEFTRGFTGANKSVQARLQEAWRRYRQDHFKLKFIWVTLGKVPKPVRAEATANLESAHVGAELLFYDGNDCCRIFDAFTYLVPAIPFVDALQVTSRMASRDEKERIESVVFPLPLVQLQDMYAAHKERLFARNVRLWKGEKAPVNREIDRSLSARPQHFFYLNNGLTVIASGVEVRDSRKPGHHDVRIFEPQIINGQQTTRTVAFSKAGLSAGSVLTRVISRRPESDKDLASFRAFVYDVVRATNNQSPVLMSELASNNREHIDIERALGKMGWVYVRRSGKLDPLEIASNQSLAATDIYGTVAMKELATALVACEHDPQFVRREGVEKLFHVDQLHVYEKLFADRKTAIDYLLTHLVYLLAKRKTEKTGTPIKKSLVRLGRYHVAFMLYELLASARRSDPEALVELLGGKLLVRRYSGPLMSLRKSLGKAWMGFYERKKSTEEDPLAFVTSKASKAAWKAFWASAANSDNRKAALRATNALASLMTPSST